MKFATMMGRHMKSNLNHILVLIELKHMRFYKDLLSFLGWKTIMEESSMMGSSDGKTSMWFMERLKTGPGEHDTVGVNHIGIAVSSVKDVDAVANYLTEQHITLLFDTPRHRPEFSTPGDTYYQVMFESPDHILFEVMYRGKK